jgi:hypothetical protein
MSKWEEIGITSYNEYLNSSQWENLKKRYIYYDKKANCWVCNRSRNLLIHHVSYKNLGSEKLYRDIYILCFNCHKAVHFWFFKVPLTVSWLLLSMRARKLIFCIQKGKFGLLLLYLTIIVLSVPINITRFFIKELFRKLSKLIWWLLRLALTRFGIDIDLN